MYACSYFCEEEIFPNDLSRVNKVSDSMSETEWDWFFQKVNKRNTEWHLLPDCYITRYAALKNLWRTDYKGRLDKQTPTIMRHSWDLNPSLEIISRTFPVCYLLTDMVCLSFYTFTQIFHDFPRSRVFKICCLWLQIMTSLQMMHV